MAYTIRRKLNVGERNKIGGISDLTAHLLFHRGIIEVEDAKKFIAPDYNRDIHDPFLLKDAEKSAGRIIEAIKNNEKIAIYSDYDADGIPGATIWNDFFTRIGFKNFSIYIPHRHDEGFGMNIDAVDQLASEDVDLIVTVDCGISDLGPIKRAVEKGMDVIITDHHEPPTQLPPAFAIVNHKQKDCMYPDKNLCGSGVAYKLIQAIIKKAKVIGHKLGEFKDGHEKWFLDMVGMATLSDMVPLVGENRVFAHYGLSVLRKSSRKGLVRLLNHLRIVQRHLTEDDIGFMITPRINAASRMGVPMDAFKLLSTDDDIEARKYVEHLDKINHERKGTVATLVKEVKKTIRERYGENNQGPMINDQKIGENLVSKSGNNGLPNVLVLGNPIWRPSLLGLVANTCAEEFNRPTFLWGRDGDGIIKGSCRSGGTVSVVEIMRKMPTGILTQYGGHFASGGFAVSDETIHHLGEHLNSAFGLLSQEHKEIGPEYIDMELPLEKVSWNIYGEIEKLAPFGTGNPKPTFLFKNIKIASLKQFGKEKNHLEFNFRKENGSSVNAIGFFMNTEQFKNKEGEMIKAGDFIDLVATMEKSMFRGSAELRLRVVDVF
ncbi:MAG: single-stranded-DNA-specific exonuclease RecJ [Patescibacteria group bacterium]